MEKFVDYGNKMPCGRDDLDVDFPWRLPGYGKKDNRWRTVGIFYYG